MKRYNITDDSGFLAIVNPGRYHSFVNDDWEFEDLVQRFNEEMRNRNLVIWTSGAEKVWHIQLLTAASERKAFREIQGLIEVTENQLLLINYEDLTMAAQFEDEKLSREANTDLLIDIENGIYMVKIRQMADPAARQDEHPADYADYELIFTPWPGD